MADTNELSVVHTCADGIKRVFIVPDEFTAEQLLAMASIDPEKEGWEVFGLAPVDGSTPVGWNTDCGISVPPSNTKPAAPSWDEAAVLASRPKLIPGSYFEWNVYFSWVTIPDGATFNGVTMASHKFLSATNNNGFIKVYGNVPADFTDDSQVILTALESYTIGNVTSGDSKQLTVPLESIAGKFWANYQYNVDGDTAIVRVGPDGGAGNIPYVTPTAPDGTVLARQQMTEFGIAPVDGYPYQYLLAIPHPMKGIWNVKFEFLGKVQYGTFNITGAQKSYTGIGLTDSPSAQPPTATAKVTAMDWYWQFTNRQANSAGGTTIYTYLGNYYILFNISNGGKPEFWANIARDGANDFAGYQKFTLTALTNDAKGYTHMFTINSAANIKTLFRIRIEGEDDSKFIYFDLTMPAPPAASTARTPFYPKTDDTGGGGGGGGSTADLKAAVTFAGTKSGGYRSTNPSLLDMGYDFINGRVRNLYNKANQTVPGGYAERYLINNRWYTHDRATKRWWRVYNDMSVASTPTNLSFNPELGILIQMFVVDLSRKMLGTSRDDKSWRDDYVSRGSQILKIQ